MIHHYSIIYQKKGDTTKVWGLCCLTSWKSFKQYSHSWHYYCNFFPSRDGHVEKRILKRDKNSGWGECLKFLRPLRRAPSFHFPCFCWILYESFSSGQSQGPGRWFYWNTEKNNGLKKFEGNYNWLELYKRNIILSGLDGRIIIVYK